MRRPALLLLGLLAALAALVGVGTATTPTEPTARAATTTPVVGGTLICPELRQAPAEQLDTRVAAAIGGATPAEQASAGSTSAGPTAGSTSAGSTSAGPTSAVTALRLGASGDPAPVALTGSGQVASDLAAGTGDGALVLTARGALAGGLQAAQLTRAAAGDRRGFEGLSCSRPQADTWFAGGSLGPGETTTLTLANPDDTAAVADVQVWSAEGPVDPRQGRGIVVAARSRTSIDVNTLAPGMTDLALHVSADRGRLVAALEHLRGPALGVEWVPQSPPPAGRVVLPALPAGPGTRTLLVTNPTDAPTVVQVQITTGSRQYVPTGLDALAVPAGSTVTADLSDLLATTPAAVAVTSQAGPVLAVGLAVDGDGPARDISYAGATAPLSGPTVLPVVAGAASTLLVSALAGDAQVVITPLPGGGPARTLAVPGGTTTALPLAGLGGALAVQVQGGPVRAVAYLREDLPDGPLTTLLALASPSRRVTRPAVVADPGAALP